MPSVTQRINQIKQPRGGYLNPKSFAIIQLDDHIALNESECLNPGLVGLVVDYMTRFMLEEDINDAFAISIQGAHMIREDLKCYVLLSQIKGLDDKSLDAAAKLVGYDVVFRAGPMHYRPVDTIETDEPTRSNIRTMVERSLRFFKEKLLGARKG